MASFFFVTPAIPAAGNVSAMSHGPFVSRDDAMTFLSRIAADARWTLYEATATGEQFEIKRSVTAVSAS